MDRAAAGSLVDEESDDLAREWSPVEVETGDSPTDWESLPMDILRLVLSRLPLRDLIRSSAVSKTWRHGAAEVHQPGLQPWLCVTDTRKFYSFTDDSVYTFPPLPDDLTFPPLPDDLTAHFCCGSFDDCLILVPLRSIGKELLRCCFYNPFTTAKISIPTPFPFKWLTYNVTLSSSPLDPSCKAAVVCQSRCRIGVTHLYSGESIVITHHQPILHIAFYNGDFYCLTFGGHLHWVDISTSQLTSFIPPPPTPPLPLWVKKKSRQKVQYRRGFQLVVFQGQLMMVCFFPRYTDINIPFAIFKADFQLKSWEEVDSLGGQAILCAVTGIHFSFTVPMTAPESLDIGGDCIYLMGWSHNHDLLIHLSKKGANQCFEIKITPQIWRPMVLPSKCRDRFFLSHSSVLTPGTLTEKTK